MVRVSGLRLEVEVRGLRLQEVLLFLVAGVLRAIQLIHIYIYTYDVHTHIYIIIDRYVQTYLCMKSYVTPQRHSKFLSCTLGSNYIKPTDW